MWETNAMAHDQPIDEKRERARLAAARWRKLNPERAREISRRAARKRRELDPEGERAKVKEARLKRLFQNPEREKTRSRDSFLRYTYGITEEEFKGRLEKQSGKCALCQEVARRFCVDHDHLTGLVRGILCWKCNVGLGLLGDDSGSLSKAIEYLKR